MDAESGHAKVAETIGSKSPADESKGAADDATSHTAEAGKRDTWTNDWEFIMSCIALSIGLGNVWRFPFIALENGGGAFLIPYLIVLVLIGQPIYYLELLVGQFSSRSSIKVYDMVPAFRGNIFMFRKT